MFMRDEYEKRMSQPFNKHKSHSRLTFVGGILGGAALGLLLAKRTGKETREALKRRFSPNADSKDGTVSPDDKEQSAKLRQYMEKGGTQGDGPGAGHETQEEAGYETAQEYGGGSPYDSNQTASVQPQDAGSQFADKSSVSSMGSFANQESLEGPDAGSGDSIAVGESGAQGNSKPLENEASSSPDEPSDSGMQTTAVHQNPKKNQKDVGQTEDPFKPADPFAGTAPGQDTSYTTSAVRFETDPEALSEEARNKAFETAVDLDRIATDPDEAVTNDPPYPT